MIGNGSRAYLVVDREGKITKYDGCGLLDASALVLIFYYFRMHNKQRSLEYRNRTLPLKNNHQTHSAHKIKISMRGLPKDFFHSQSQSQQQLLMPRMIRCKTQASNKQFQQTSYFQQSETLSPKRTGREYKSEQRRRISNRALHHNDVESATSNDTSIMDCTFFRNNKQESRPRVVSGGQLGSGQIQRKTYKNPIGLHLMDIDLSSNKHQINSIFKAREGVKELSFHRLRPGLQKGLPLIRLCRPRPK